MIARCSQPEVGWLGWRSSADEDLLKAIADACAYDRGQCTMMDRSSAGLSPSKKTESETDGSVGKVCGIGNVAYMPLSLSIFTAYTLILIKCNFVKADVHTAVNSMITFFWDVTLCNLLICIKSLQ